ncbi:MAG TPA: polyprenyl synthetase family protein [Micromonosporaceae bacterium]|jgi:geranylgeranyl diphosphate synthase type I|nr:polyprenyl synthetase family protein [Micromonosporaceae bacterium]
MSVLVEGRSAAEVLAWSRTMVDPALRAAVDSLPESMRHIAGYHFGWWDERGRPALGSPALGSPALGSPALGSPALGSPAVGFSGPVGGKAIRPALVLLAAEAVGAASADAVPAAAAVELVHNFSLLHDDVMDGDLTRRHRKTAWSVFGVNAAILAGDALLALALDILAGSGQPAAVEGVRMVAAAVLDLIEGQSADLAFETRTAVALPDCVRMAEGKTGALLGCACAIGVAFGGGRPRQATQLRAFGAQLGLAFQHVDDLLGIWGDPAITGKPVHSDLQRRKKSLPVVAALTSGTPAGAELAAFYRREQALSGADLARAAELVELAGGRAWSRAQADDLLAAALDHLRSAGPVPRTATELATLALFATRRDC